MTSPLLQRIAAFADWDESKVHRGEGGRFGSQSGSQSGVMGEGLSGTPVAVAGQPGVLESPLFRESGDQTRGALGEADLPAPVRAAISTWAASLPAAEARAVKDYTTINYQYYNRMLRGQGVAFGDMGEQMHLIQKALLSAPALDAPMTTWRGMDCSTPAKLQAIEDGLKAAHASGDSLRMPGFGSSSIDPHRAASWGNRQVVLEIKSRRASYVAAHSAHPEELEVLHPHNARYKVTAVRDSVPFVVDPDSGATATRRTYTLEEADEGSVRGIDPENVTADSQGAAPTPPGGLQHDPAKEDRDDKSRFLAKVASDTIKDMAARWGEKQGSEAGLTPEEINDGFCSWFAHGAVREIQQKRGLEVGVAGSHNETDEVYTSRSNMDDSGEGHMWVTAGGKHYDAERPDGVDDPHDLPWFTRHPGFKSLGRTSKVDGHNSDHAASRFARFSDWDEGKVHRDDKGRFGSGGAAVASPAPAVPGSFPGGLLEAAKSMLGLGPKRVSVASLTGIEQNPLFRDMGDRERTQLSELSLPKPVLEAAKAWASSLTPRQCGSLSSYTTVNYTHYNGMLRHGNGGTANHREDIETIQRTLLSAPLLDKPMTTWRGLACSTLTKMKEIESGMKAALASGAPLTLTGLNSASLDAEIAADWGSGEVVLEIKSRRASYVASMSDSPHELEVLHPHGATYKVTAYHPAIGFSRAGSGSGLRRVYVLEEVHEEKVQPTHMRGSKPQFSDWDENAHPRGEGGRFGSGGAGAGTTGESARPAPVQPPHPLFYDYGPAEARPEMGPSDVPNEVESKTRKWAASLSQEQIGAIKAYTGAGYYDLNKALRLTPNPQDLGSEDAQQASLIQSALLSYPALSRPMTTWRGLACSSHAKRQKIEEGLQQAHASGEPLRLDGFTSSSMDADMASLWGLGCVIEIRSRRGAYIAGMSKQKHELEVLHPHGSQYRVVAVHAASPYPDGALRRTYVLEDVDHAPVHFAGTGWDESSHPRGEGGRFGSHTGAVASQGESERVHSADGDHPAFRQYGPDEHRPAAGRDCLPPELAEAVERWANGLSEEQQEGIWDYTGVHYEGLNSALRATPDPDHLDASDYARASLIQKAVLTAPVSDRPVTSWRGVNCSSTAKRQRIEEGLDAAAASGSPVRLDGFGSATLNPDLACEWSSRLVLEIRSKRVSFIASMSKSRHELEVLHPHGAQYRVLAVHAAAPYGEGERKTYVLEEIEPGPAAFAFFGDWDESKVHRGQGGRFAPSASGQSTVPDSASAGGQPGGDQTGGHWIDDPFGSHERVWQKDRDTDDLGSHPLFRQYGPDDVRPKLSAAELPADVQREAQKWVSHLSGLQYSALENYTGEDSDTVNRPMRLSPESLDGMHPSARDMAGHIDAALRDAPLLNAPMTSWRGVHTSKPAKLDQIENGLRAAFASGEPVSLPGFGSASINPSFAATTGSIVLEIRSKRASYVEPLSLNPHELEVLHPHNQPYRVVAIHEDAPYGDDDPDAPVGLWRRTYVLEEAGEAPPLPAPPPDRWQKYVPQRASEPDAYDPDIPFGATGGLLDRLSATFSDWDESKVHRGENGRFGSHAGTATTGTAPTGEAGDSADAGHADRARIRDMGAAGITASGLPPEQQEFFAACLDRALAGIPAGALQRIVQTAGKFHFYGDAASLSMAILVDVPGQSEQEGRDRAQYREMVRLGNWAAAGAYDPSNGNLHLNGQKRKGGMNLKGKPFDPHGEETRVYAHELTHAIDGPKMEISSSPEWRDAWESEIKTRTEEGAGGRILRNPVSEYADQAPEEGLAELSMLLYTKARPLADFERDFPKCKAILEKYGAWPHA